MRALSRLLAVLLGLVLLLGGLALALEIGLSYAAGHPVLFPYRSWLAYGRRTSWQSGAVLITAGVVLLVGVLMLLTTIRRRRPLAVAGAARERMTVTFARGPLEKALGRLATRTSGLEDVRVRLGKKQVAVSGSSLSRDLKTAGDGVRQSVAGGLQRLPLAAPPAVDVDLRRAEV